MASLIFDIETVGEDFESLDKTTQEVLTKWIKQESEDEKSYEMALRALKNRLDFSPLTAEIVAIGILDHEEKSGVVYYQSPGKPAQISTKGEYSLKSANEKEMLKEFWSAATKYQNFVSFNGRAFDAPFLIIRSAIHKIKPTVDLMEGRYLYQQRGVRHIDLLDQMTFYGALWRKGGLHLWSRAFGIKSPKAEGVSGDDMSKLFEEGKFLEIAKYNIGDLQATSELYDRWLNFFSP